MSRHPWRLSLSRFSILLVLFMAFVSSWAQALPIHGQSHRDAPPGPPAICGPSQDSADAARRAGADTGTVSGGDSLAAHLSEVLSLLQACDACPDALPFQAALPTRAVVFDAALPLAPTLYRSVGFSHPERPTRYARPAERAPPAHA